MITGDDAIARLEAHLDQPSAARVVWVQIDERREGRTGPLEPSYAIDLTRRMRRDQPKRIVWCEPDEVRS